MQLADVDRRAARRHRPLGCATVVAAGLIALASVHPALAVEPDEVLPDARLEERARTLSSELRCLVCQNQSIDDSNAPLARDLRLLVRERLKAGDSDSQVKQFLVARYGDFVLLKPPFSAGTLLLWLTPLLALLGGVALVWRSLRRQPGVGAMSASGNAALAGQKLSQAEEEKLAKLLREQSS